MLRQLQGEGLCRCLLSRGKVYLVRAEKESRRIKRTKGGLQQESVDHRMLHWRLSVNSQRGESLSNEIAQTDVRRTLSIKTVPSKLTPANNPLLLE